MENPLDTRRLRYFVAVAEEAGLIQRIGYPHVEQDEIFDMPGIVSRKKQVIPYLTSLLKEMASEGALPAAVSRAPFRKKRTAN